MNLQPNYLRRLPLKDDLRYIDVNIRKGNLADAEIWQQYVQVHIAQTAGRIDAGWNWPALFTRWMMSESVIGRDVSLFCLEVPGETDRAVPLAIMLISEGYPSLDGSHENSVYLWYLASAPTMALLAMGFVHPRPCMIVEALLDVAIQRSYELGYDGRVGLHAAKEGGTGLFNRYRDNVRMKALLSAASLTIGRKLKGGNDGRYFWTDPKLSQSLANSLNYLR
jgi:hypothetical protein